MSIHALIIGQTVENTINITTENTASFLEGLEGDYFLLPVEKGYDYFHYSTSSQDIVAPLSFSMADRPNPLAHSGSYRIDFTSSLEIASIENIHVTHSRGDGEITFTHISSGSNNLHLSMSHDNSEDPNQPTHYQVKAEKIIDSQGFEYDDFLIFRQ